MSDDKLTFRQYFFRLYDKKILSGEITFSQIGISKSTFNELCNNVDFEPTEELLQILKRGMKLSAEEERKLYTYL